MKIDFVRPKGISTGGEFCAPDHAKTPVTASAIALADITALAAAETSTLARRRVLLQGQMDELRQRQRALSCAAAAHHVLQRHPDAAVLVFAVREDRPYLLANVLDSEGRILSARRTGGWAETVMAEVRHAPAAALTRIDGVEAEGGTLRVTISTVAIGVAGLVVTGPGPHQPASLFRRKVTTLKCCLRGWLGLFTASRGAEMARSGSPRRSRSHP